MIQRTRNDNVSGRVPMSAQKPVPDQLVTCAAQLAALVREKRFTEAQELLATLEKLYGNAPADGVPGA